MIEFIGSFDRGRPAFFCKLIIVCLVCWNISGWAVKAQGLLPSVGDPLPIIGQRRGVIIVNVNYGEDGKVQTCQVLRSNAPLALESSTLDYIRKHWGGPFFAESHEVVPLVFEEAPTTPYWNGEMAPPPNFFPDDGREHEITLRVTFANDGWVETCKVILPSGVELADRETMAWIKVHWHSAAFANRTVDAPFVFKPAQIETPAPAVTPESPEQVPVENVQPEKATPAVRAQ